MDLLGKYLLPMKYSCQPPHPPKKWAFNPGFYYQIIGITGKEETDNDTMRTESEIWSVETIGQGNNFFNK